MEDWGYNNRTRGLDGCLVRERYGADVGYTGRGDAR
jgi:hypothetical protein